jgi:hypothetical protein
MPRILVKTTYFITINEDHIRHIQQGSAVQIRTIRDELDDGTVEETWVEITPEKSQPILKITP